MQEKKTLRIKELLRSKGMTGKALGEVIGSHGAYVSDLVRGKKSPSIDMLLKIAQALDVDIRELFEPTKPDYEELKNKEAIESLDKMKTILEDFYKSN